MKSITPRHSVVGVKYDVRTSLYGKKTHIGTYPTLAHALHARTIMEIAIVLNEAASDADDVSLEDHQLVPLDAMLTQLRATINEMSQHLEMSPGLFMLLDIDNAPPHVRTGAIRGKQLQAAPVAPTHITQSRFVEIFKLLDPVPDPEHLNKCAELGISEAEYYAYFRMLCEQGRPV